MVAAGPVHVSVRELFRRGRPYRGHLDLEVEVLARKRMIAVQCHHVASDLRDRHGARTLRRVGLQPHTDPHVGDPLEPSPRHPLHEPLVVLAVTIAWSDLYLQPVTGLAAGQLALESRNKVAVAVQVRERLTFSGTVD